nr:hypothetical protein [Planococcus glaciei]
MKQGKEGDINETIPHDMIGKLDIPGPLWNLMSTYKMVAIEEPENVNAE